jgi:DHA2 family multidrug resistance protein
LTTFGIGRHEARAAAYARIYELLQGQAATLAYIDTFMVLCIGAGIMFCLAFLLKKNDPGGGGVHIAE